MEVICNNKTVHVLFSSFVRPLMGSMIGFEFLSSFRVCEKILPAQAEEEITEIGIVNSSVLVFCLNQALWEA